MRKWRYCFLCHEWRLVRDPAQNYEIVFAVCHVCGVEGCCVAFGLCAPDFVLGLRRAEEDGLPVHESGAIQ